MAYSFLDTYADEIKNQFDYLVTWPLNSTQKLGDVGILENGIFKRTSTLKELGINVPRIRKQGGTAALEHSSANGVECTLQPEVSSGIHGLGGKVDIKFSREFAVFLRVGEHVISEFESTNELGKDILSAYDQGSWPRDRIVITKVVSAPSFTLLVSGGREASASFTIDASLPALEALSSGKFSQLVGLTGSFATKVIGENVTPLIQTCGLRRKFFGMDFKSATAYDVSAYLAFERVDSTDQLED